MGIYSYYRTAKEINKMKTYFIYDMNTEELLGTVETTSIESAERKASELFNYESNKLFALTERI